MKFLSRQKRISQTAILFLFVVAFLLKACNFATTGHIKPFSSDGCSLFPDRSLIDSTDWCLCCYEHDLRYWQGGTEQERAQADSIFKQCILEKTGNRQLAEVMYRGVRLGGSPSFPTWYCWGYGWDYRRGYKALTPAEKKEVRLQFQKKQTKKNTNVCH